MKQSKQNTLLATLSEWSESTEIVEIERNPRGSLAKLTSELHTLVKKRSGVPAKLPSHLVLPV